MPIKITKLLVFIASTLFLSACSQFSYYAQSINGQWEVNRLREPISDVLAKEKTPEWLRKRLTLVKQARHFASETLLLPENKSYTEYVDLNRDYIVWNIIHTKPLSIDAETSCFLVVGCLSYRGYFEKDTAIKKAKALKSEGYDVYLGGVAAYSTLGWFDDPVLNTMMHWDDAKLISILFHELAHQKLYIKNDTEFNEAFADAVALIGLRKWLYNKDQNVLQDYLRKEDIHEEFVQLILDYRTQLELLYNNRLNTQDKLKRKQIIFKGLINAYETLKIQWQTDEYDNWFYSNLNNAKLAAVATYRNLLPAFMALFNEQNQNLSDFYQAVYEIGKLEKNVRHKKILSYIRHK